MSGSPNILIISDIHAVTATDASAHASRSFVATRHSTGGLEADPFDQLVVKLQEEQIQIGLILCPGDLTDQAEPTGLSYVTSRLRALKSELGATGLAILPGNHDIDSRYRYDDADSRDRIMRLRPHLPFGDRQSFLEFWTENFSIREFEDVRVVALNSTAFHGGGKTPNLEMEHGRISAFTLDSLTERLGALPAGKINILICHHHPLRNNLIREVDYSEMSGGHALMQLLGSGAYGQWTVVHGHKHRPRLEYGPGGGSAALVLGAASFSFRVQRDALNNSPNQFHVLAYDDELATAIRSDHAGHVLSWNWILETGWTRASGELGLPHDAGFGSRSGPNVLAGDIATTVKTMSFVRWDQLTARHPELLAKLPSDVEQILKILNDQHNIGCALDNRTKERQLAVRS
ncbi:MAG TPA: metallophosphoesterase [Sphingomicrobium sp.]|jgi:hypothetical protein|nr:metallophosphoesterase [Sphingomicrobium sp.]